MLKTVHSCPSNCDLQNSDEFEDSSTTNTKDLQDEIRDLKIMLDMQEIINQEQEQKLEAITNEKVDLINEKNSYISKINLLQEELERKTLSIKQYEEKIAELKGELSDAKKNFENERERICLLTKENVDLQQKLEKKNIKMKKLRCQLDDERSFYAQEKARYCKEMKQKRNHSTEVQTDNLNTKDETTCVLQDGADFTELNRLRTLYKYQLITTCLICEKYIRLRRYKDVLIARLSETRKEYKKAMLDIMLQFDQCRNEYTTLLEDKFNDDNSSNMLKIVNRSNRLASDNAVLKQELLHLNNRLMLLKSFHNLEDEDEKIVFPYQLTYNCNNNSDNINTNVNNNEITDNKLVKKNNQKPRRLKHYKKKSNCNTNKMYSDQPSTSLPASSENDSDYKENNSKVKKNKKRNRNRFKKSKNNRTPSVESVNTSFSDTPEISTYQNYNHVKVCPSFISFSSDNFKNNLQELKITEIIDHEEFNCKNIVNKEKTGYFNENTEPAYLQVTCDEVKPFVNKDGELITKSTKQSVSLRNDLQEWLAKTPVIECSEWSNSVQGTEVFKTESAPELLLSPSDSRSSFYR